MPVNDIMIMAKNFAESGMFTDANKQYKRLLKYKKLITTICKHERYTYYTRQTNLLELLQVL
jgi:hypothetical protein